MNIPFNKPHLSGKEISYIIEASNKGILSGDGEFTKKCSSWLEKNFNVSKALLTHSCTAALEMSAILIDIEPGDEVILPSYTFTSTANAFALRGAKLVFIDIRSDTLNIDETKIAAAITSKTKAIVPVHYAGVSCEMDQIMSIAEDSKIYVIEDAAQGFGSSYKGKALGSIGHFGTLSFHETKNIISGEGGALLINDVSFIKRAEIIREKGTNRSRFFRGQVDKYTWVDIGSSFLPSEITAAFLFAQLEQSEVINFKRMEIWNYYKNLLLEGVEKGRWNIPFIPEDCQHNAHLFYLVFPTADERSKFIEFCHSKGIKCIFHYIPLHSSLAGLKYGRVEGGMSVTNSISERIVRLPLYVDLTEQEIKYITNNLLQYLRG